MHPKVGLVDPGDEGRFRACLVHAALEVDFRQLRAPIEHLLPLFELGELGQLADLVGDF